MPSDNQLKAIGLVAAQWSVIDNNLTVLAHGLYGEDRAAREEFDRMQVFRHRLRMVRDLVDRQIREPFRTYMLQHVDKIGSIVIERDKIIHGMWGGAEENPAEKDGPYGATHSFNWSGPKPSYDWRLSYGRIMEVALKIDALGFELFDFLAKVMGSPPSFQYNEALQRISRQPSPPPEHEGPPPSDPPNDKGPPDQQ
jgi:hypothetical protein